MLNTDSSKNIFILWFVEFTDTEPVGMAANFILLIILQVR
jgi:hypothetical protein